MRSDRKAKALEQLARLHAARRARFADIEAIRAKNADLDRYAVAQEVAAEIAAMRAEHHGTC